MHSNNNRNNIEISMNGMNLQLGGNNFLPNIFMGPGGTQVRYENYSSHDHSNSFCSYDDDDDSDDDDSDDDDVSHDAYQRGDIINGTFVAHAHGRVPEYYYYGDNSDEDSLYGSDFYDYEDDDDDDDVYGGESEEEEESVEPVVVTKVRQSGKQIMETCVICTDEVDKSKKYSAYLACHHWFHFDCVHKWIEMKRKCPHCMHKTSEIFVNAGN